MYSGFPIEENGQRSRANGRGGTNIVVEYSGFPIERNGGTNIVPVVEYSRFPIERNGQRSRGAHGQPRNTLYRSKLQHNLTKALVIAL